MSEMTEKLELKPCPFCGEKLVHDSEHYSGPIWERLYQSYRVECPKCCASTTEYMTAKEAIDAWNNRPIEDEFSAKIDELRKEREIMLEELYAYQGIAREAGYV